MKNTCVLRFAVILAASVLPFAGCTRGFEVLVMPGATVDTLVFGFGDFHGGALHVVPSSIGVFRCESIRKRASGSYYPSHAEAVWYSRVRTIDGAKPANRIAYGRDDHGLHTEQGPAPLMPGGCYVVRVRGHAVQEMRQGGGAGFKVGSNGNIVQMTRREYERVFRNAS